MGSIASLRTENSKGELRLKRDPLARFRRMYPLLSDEQLNKKIQEYKTKLEQKNTGIRR